MRKTNVAEEVYASALCAAAIADGRQRCHSFLRLRALGRELESSLPGIASNTSIHLALKLLLQHYAAEDRANTIIDDENVEEGGVLIATAYSSDYTIGPLCEAVNRAYAARHGYEFLCEVRTYQDMMASIAPREFLGWWKIDLLRRLLVSPERRQELTARGVKFVLWIDADAMVIDQAQSLRSIISRAGGRHLVIAEDQSPSCLINSGVMLLRICDWSAELMTEVWETPTKHFSTLFYEQSALLDVLRRRHEGLHDVRPFHSFCDGPTGPKLFLHVCVLPCVDFNSNVCSGLVRQGDDVIDGAEVDIEGSDFASAMRRMRKDDSRPSANARFIFHALGRSAKLLVLLAVIRKHLPELLPSLPTCAPLRLVRGAMGKAPSAQALARAGIESEL